MCFKVISQFDKFKKMNIFRFKNILSLTVKTNIAQFATPKISSNLHARNLSQQISPSTMPQDCKPSRQLAGIKSLPVMSVIIVIATKALLVISV